MSQSLCFNEITLSPITHQNSLWIRAAELARALGYKDENSVRRIYDRNQEEFTPEMTQVIEIPDTVNLTVTGNLLTKARIFSLRGCHLIAMFARTPVAKAFRRWVLDVLDKLAVEEQTALAGDVNPFSLSPAQQAHIHAIVAAKVGMLPIEVQRKAYGEIWSRFGRHFQIAKYQQLPPARMGEAVEYLVGMEVKAAQKALPPSQPATSEIHVDRLHLTPWDKVQLGKEAVAILERCGKVGPRTLECILLKLRYLNAIHDVLKLGNTLAADIKKMRVGVFGEIVQAGNATGCPTDSVMDILYEDTYRLQKLGDDFQMTAFRALNASICGAKMQGV